MKKMTKVFSLLSAAMMITACAMSASAETAEENQERKRSELLPQLTEAREIDPADPNYPILAWLELERSTIDYCCQNYRAAHYSANDETGRVVEHYVYVPDGGVSVHETYKAGKKNPVDIDILSFWRYGSVVMNPYKAYVYQQQDLKDLNGNYLDTAGECVTIVWGCISDVTPKGANDADMLQAFMNSSSEIINVNQNTEGYYEGNDKFEVRYFLNEDGGAVVTDIAFRGSKTDLPKVLSKDFFPAPTEIQGYPVAEILPGAYAYLYWSSVSVTEQKIFYVDPMSEEEPVSLVAEVKFGDGDITEDGEFTVSDAVYGARMIAEDKTLQVTDTGRAAADMDANGKVDTKDLSLMLDLLAAYN